MSIKQVIKYIELKSQLGPEELYLAESFASMTESDKQALMDMWGVKPKASKPVTKRVIEKCDTQLLNGETCGLTRRAAIHKPDSTAVEAHEFFQSSSKSKRASGIAATLGNRSRKPSQQPICVECGESDLHSNHELGGHEFTTDLAKRVNAVLDGATKPDPDDEERCTATREGGRTCNLLLDHNVHQMKTAMGYHEFVGNETAVGASGD